MIGFIALAGIEVRNSILFADFAKNKVHQDMDIREAVPLRCVAARRAFMPETVEKPQAAASA